jgi:hypothetical protein
VSNLLYPDVIDAGTLQPKLTSAIYLPVGVEGQKDVAGTGVVGTLYVINRVDESSTLFGPASSLHRIVKAVLDRGAGPVIAVASASATTPTLVQRQAAWEKLESDETVRLRLTDSELQADIVALCTSAANADLLYNKQIALVGMPSGTAKAALITAVDAIVTAGASSARRGSLIGPGVYDDLGTLRGGSFAAAAVAAQLAKNSDPTNDLDLSVIPLLSATEKGADGLSVFRRKVVAGSAVNDYEDLLTGGVSPLQPSRLGSGVQITHLRMAFKADGSYDSMQTRIIVDQIFLDVKAYIMESNYLNAVNSETVRARIKSGVEAVLLERGEWIKPVEQPDGSQGYNVSVVSSADNRQVVIGYEGVVRRGISTVKVAPTLSIPV